MYFFTSVAQIASMILVLFCAVTAQQPPSIRIPVFPLLQAYKVMVVAVAYFLYAYARPYETTFVNIMEIVLLAYLGVFLTLKQDLQQQTVFNIHLDETSVDSCGKAVLPSIDPARTVLGVLYFLPVTVLLFLLGRWLCSRMVHILRYVGGMQAFHVCVLYKLHSVIRYTVRMCVCTLLYFSPYTIRKTPCKGAQEVHLSGPTNCTNSTTDWRNVTESTIELS